MAFSCLQKSQEKCVLLFYQIKGSNSGFLEGVQWYMVWAPSLKVRKGGCWWILNCYNSRGLVFSEILVGGGGYISLWGPNTFLHINCYIRIWLFYFLEFTFPKIWWNFYIFLKIFLIFSLIFLFMQLPRSVVFNSPGHDIKMAARDPGPSRLYEKGKAFFNEPYILVMVPASADEKLT